MEVHSIVALHSEEIWGDEASKREADRTHARKKKGKSKPACNGGEANNEC
jgi:hypothetical protein